MPATTTRPPALDPARSALDPLDPKQWNRYIYVGGDPINFSDPSGLSWWDSVKSFVGNCLSGMRDIIVPYSLGAGLAYAPWELQHLPHLKAALMGGAGAGAAHAAGRAAIGGSTIIGGLAIVGFIGAGCVVGHRR